MSIFYRRLHAKVELFKWWRRPEHQGLNRRTYTRDAQRDAMKSLRRDSATRGKGHYRNQEQCFGQAYFSLRCLSYKFKDVSTERIKGIASLEQVENKAETVSADSQYVLRTFSHCMAKSQPNRVSRVELRKLVTRP